MPSTVIEFAHYDALQQTLQIKYRNGKTYKYFEVPQNIYDEYKASFSKGQYLNTVIKERFKFEREEPL